MEWKTLEELAYDLNDGAKMIVAVVNDPVRDITAIDVVVIYPDGSQAFVVPCDHGWCFAERRSYSDAVRD